MIYPLAFAGSLGSLALWFIYKTDNTKSRLFQRSFFIGFTVFILSALLADVSWSVKLGVLFRDLLAMAGFGLVFQLLAVRKKWLAYGIIASVIAFSGYYQAFMSKSFEPRETGSAQLDAEGELLVELAEGANIHDILATAESKYHIISVPAFSPASPESTELDDYYIVDIPTQFAGETALVIKEIQKANGVDWVEPNEMISITPMEGRIPSNPKKELGLNDQYLDQLWGFQAMNIKKLLDYLDSRQVTPQRKALIVILDTGIDAKHEDIKDNYRSIKAGNDNDPQGHGTHCAGIAAAVSNNGVGVASFSRDNSYIEVSSIKVLNASGMGTQRGIIDGIIQAADAGADVISMSLGGVSNQSRERAYRQAVEYANKKGAIVVAAAGNSNRNAKGYAPAGVTGVIAVSAIDEELQRAVFSNYVTDVKMGVAAPGVNIYSTIPRDQYASYNGTSMATPYAAGLIGLLKSIKPSLDTKEVYDILKKTGKPTKNTKETGLLIYPYEAVKLLVEQQ